MSSYRHLTAAILASLTLGACAGAPEAPVIPGSETRREASATRLALREAGAAARAYGQAHLGHFLDLGQRHLRKEGLELPPGITLTVRTDHTSFCLIATNGSLPSIHPWAVGMTTSKSPQPSSKDRCDNR